MKSTTRFPHSIRISGFRQLALVVIHIYAQSFFLTPLEKACISNVISGPTYPISSSNFLSVSLRRRFTYRPTPFHDLLSASLLFCFFWLTGIGTIPGVLYRILD